MKNNYDFPVELKSLYQGNDYQLIPNRQAVVRTDTNLTLGIVSKGYGLVKHSTVIDTFREASKDFGIEEKIGLTNDGGNLFYEMLFPKVEAEVAKGDIIRMRMVVKNSYNGLNSLTIVFGALRLVCLNGMVVGTKMFSFNYRHTKNIGVFSPDESLDSEQVKKALEEYIAGFANSMDVIKKMAETKIEISDKLFDKELSNIRLPQYLLDEAKVSFESQDDKSAWGYYNSLTFAITHKMKKPNPSIDILYGTEAWKATQRVM